MSFQTYPNIAFVVEQLSYYNSNLLISYLHIIKQILGYLKRSNSLNIEWKKNLVEYSSDKRYKEFRVIKYADSSYAGNIEKYKLNIRYNFFFGYAIVTWYSKQ